MIKDFIGQDCDVGDYFAYSVLSGRSPVLGIYKLVEIRDEYRVTAQLVAGNSIEWKKKTYDYDTGKFIPCEVRKSYLQGFCNKAIKIDHSRILQENTEGA